MKTKLLTILLIFIVALPLSAAPPYKSKSAGPIAASVDNDTYIDVNRILMFVTNHGNFARDLSGVFGYDAGTFFPYSTVEDIRSGLRANYCLYAGGLWVGGIVNGETRVIVSEYSDEYAPGPMVNGTFSPDKPEYRVYKLYRDSVGENANQDYKDWPVDQGAPYIVVGNDTLPDLIGDQMLWSVCNDADPKQHTNDAGYTKPLGLEVRQTTFAFDRQGALGNIIFVRYRIYNKGVNTIENCYFSLWADPDLGEYTDDLVGCDTNLSLGFVYNSDDDDAGFYEDKPPCTGIDFFQGPLVVGGPDDTAYMWGDTIIGYRNLGMVSFNKYINGTDPNDFNETYNYMQGLSPNGDPYVFGGDTLLYMHSGDPVAGTGDLDTDPADRRWMQSTGPITFAPGDSTEILAAIIVGLGGNRLESITIVKELDDFAQRVYENNFNPPKPPAKPKVRFTPWSGQIVLTWNDTSEVDPGDFPFEGYSVWQGESPTGDESGEWTLLATFDLASTKEPALVDSVRHSESGLIIPWVRRTLTNQGLQYTYRITQDKIRGGPLREQKPYYLRVTAFSFAYWQHFPTGDSARVPNADRLLESQTVMTIIPQAPPAGEHPAFGATDTIPTVHIGGSDGFVYPIVTEPRNLNGHTYMVIFEEDNQAGWDAGTPNGIVWHLVDSTTGDTLLKEQTDQEGAPGLYVVDGMYVEVHGPPLLGVDWDYASADPPNLSDIAVAEHPDYEGGRWFTGAAGSDGELLGGGVYLAPSFWMTTLGPTDYKTVDIRFRPMESYTDLTGDGLFTSGEPYVVEAGTDDSKAFMYTGWSNSDYEGFFDVPFTAWDMTDPDNPRQLNVVVRDRDGNYQWDAHFLTADDQLPNGGDLQYNYIWVLNTDYDATGTMYDDGTSGIGFMDEHSDAMWLLWLGERGTTRGILAEEGTLTLVPPVINTPVDTFKFVAKAPSFTQDESDLDNIKVVPNPFYLYGPYDPSVGTYEIKFHNLPSKCKITIYNLAGEYIREIEKDDPSTNFATWNAQTENGLPVASGIYLWVVDAPGFGQKIGKMAIFTEVEVLKTY